MKSLADASISKNWGSVVAYRERRLNGFQTGIKRMDQSLLGLGGIVTLQGETGATKSTLALQIVSHNLSVGNPCLVIDRENGEGRLRFRLMCQKHQVSETQLKICSQDELRDYARGVSKYPLYIYTEATKDQDLLTARVEEMLAVHPDRPGILLIDSLQAMPVIDSDQRVNLERWLHYFDSLKLQFDGRLMILVTSEKNRSSYGNNEVGGAKGTNAVEYKSEVLLDMRLGNAGEIIVKVIKNRDGQRGQEFVLEKKFSEPANPNSFTFTLGSSEVGEL